MDKIAKEKKIQTSALLAIELLAQNNGNTPNIHQMFKCTLAQRNNSIACQYIFFFFSTFGLLYQHLNVCSCVHKLNLNHTEYDHDYHINSELKTMLAHFILPISYSVSFICNYIIIIDIHIDGNILWNGFVGISSISVFNSIIRRRCRLHPSIHHSYFCILYFLQTLFNFNSYCMHCIYVYV